MKITLPSSINISNPISLCSLVFALSIFLSSCSLLEDSSDHHSPKELLIGENYSDDAPHLENFDIFISRGSLTGTEFEHHIYANNSLIQECGTIDRGRFNILEQTVKRVSKKLISYQAGEIAQDLSSAIEDSSSDWEKPGKSNSLTDPGEINASFNIEGSKHKISTNLDSITLKRVDKEKYLNRFIRAVRGIKLKLEENSNLPEEKKGLICGHQDFYGLGIVK